jgi:transcriptional regulator with XRE-family HTH domain
MRQRLRSEREKLGLTQREVAERIGKSEILIRKLEKGACNPSLKTLFQLERLYGVNHRELFPDLFDDKFFIKMTV